MQTNNSNTETAKATYSATHVAIECVFIFSVQNLCVSVVFNFSLISLSRPHHGKFISFS